MTKKPILIVEPDAGHHETIARLVTQWGYPLVRAGGPEEAIERFEALTPDLVILNAWIKIYCAPQF